MEKCLFGSFVHFSLGYLAFDGWLVENAIFKGGQYRLVERQGTPNGIGSQPGMCAGPHARSLTGAASMRKPRCVPRATRVQARRVTPPETHVWRATCGVRPAPQTRWHSHLAISQLLSSFGRWGDGGMKFPLTGPASFNWPILGSRLELQVSDSDLPSGSVCGPRPLNPPGHFRTSGLDSPTLSCYVTWASMLTLSGPQAPG